MATRWPFAGRSTPTLSFQRPASPPPSPSPATPHQKAEPGSRLESRPGSLPLTPPSTSARRTASKTSFRTTSSHWSHREYMDSLHPPSAEEFARLARLQEQREKEHRHRDHELQRQNIATARKSMEARRDFMHAKAVDEEQETTHRTRRSSFRRRFSHSLSRSRSRAGSKEAPPSTPSKEGDNDRDRRIQSKAATVIQRSYRGYRVRREMQGLGIDASTRWTHAIRDAQWKELTTPRAREDSISGSGNGNSERPSTSRSVARQNWMKVAAIARRAGADEDSDHSATGSSSLPDDDEFERLSPEQKEAARRKRAKAREKRRKHAKMMGLQYFLEMVDLKHRYGSNLRTYHEEWKKADTNENFFYWLDYGEGRNIDLVACPRERLDREQVRYLSREERQYYLVNVDWEGRLVWAKNGVRIDTTEQWKDSIHGIVPIDDPTPAFSPEVESHVQAKPSIGARPYPHDHSNPASGADADSNSDSDSSRESELEAAMAAKYANPGFDNARGVRKIRHVSAATIFDKLLRKSVRRNTWIFVADTSFRLYVGIKSSGAFQHSSFLRGSRISAAGLVKVKNGRLSSLSPLSGHYRPPASNFRAFVHSLEDEGVDMSRVSISKSYAVLVGLEAYVATRRKGKEAVRAVTHQKQRLLEPEAARRREEAEMDTSESAARERRVLEKEERTRGEDRAGLRFWQRIGLGLGLWPWRQKGGGALRKK